MKHDPHVDTELDVIDRALEEHMGVSSTTQIGRYYLSHFILAELELHRYLKLRHNVCGHAQKEWIDLNEHI